MARILNNLCNIYSQIETNGKYVVSTFCKTLWYLDSHFEKKQSRNIELMDCERLRGFNDWKLRTIKQPQVYTRFVNTVYIYSFLHCLVRGDYLMSSIQIVKLQNFWHDGRNLIIHKQ